ncbi:MAG: hypothetical protein AAFN59_14395 [Pseudomonadota bacterium]
MATPDWSKVLAGLSPHRPTDLDAQDTKAPPPGRLSGPQRAPSSKLFAQEVERAGIGIRVRTPLADPSALAARLAAIALERDLMPVILSEVPRSGFERWGFRVERISGATQEDRDAMVEEVKAFWAIAVVIDAADVHNLR